jgi:hypothetical protein
MFHVFRNFAFDFHFNQASQPCFLWHMGLNRMAVERIQPQSVPTSLQNSFESQHIQRKSKKHLTEIHLENQNLLLTSTF